MPGIAQQLESAPMATSRKRRESFGAIRKRSSGRYQASYVGLDGQRYNAPHTFDAMQDARSWLRRKKVEMDSGEWQSHAAASDSAAKQGRTDTLADYAAEWFTTRVNRKGEGLRPRTRVEYERLIAGPLAPLAARRMASLTPAEIRTWYAGQLDRGTATQAGRAYSLLKSILTTAVTDGRIKVNPCQMRGAANASTGRKVVPPTPLELQRIADNISPRYRAAVLIAAWAGCRYGELTELRRRDVVVTRDESRRVVSITVNVSRAVTHVTGQGFVIGATKSEAGVRSIALPPHIFSDVVAHLNAYTADFPDSLLFPASDGIKHLSESTFVRYWYPARSSAGREDLPFHGLRHYGATRFAQTGATLAEIQARLGHSTVSAAMKYQHAAGRDEELAHRMSEMERAQ